MIAIIFQWIGVLAVYLTIGRIFGWFVDTYRDPMGHGLGALLTPFWPVAIWFFLRCPCGKFHCIRMNDEDHR